MDRFFLKKILLSTIVFSVIFFGISYSVNILLKGVKVSFYANKTIDVYWENVSANEIKYNGSLNLIRLDVSKCSDALCNINENLYPDSAYVFKVRIKNLEDRKKTVYLDYDRNLDNETEKYVSPSDIRIYLGFKNETCNEYLFLNESKLDLCLYNEKEFVDYDYYYKIPLKENEEKEYYVIIYWPFEVPLSGNLFNVTIQVISAIK